MFTLLYALLSHCADRGNDDDLCTRASDTFIGIILLAVIGGIWYAMTHEGPIGELCWALVRAATTH